MTPKTLYMVFVGCSTDILFTEDEILINNYSDSTAAYDAFDNTARIVAGVYGGNIELRELADELYEVVELMFEEITPDNTSDGHIARYLMKHSTKPSIKGILNGNCNVTACQQPGAEYYNKSTQAYYCADCAEKINWPGGRAEVMKLYGVPLLCEKD